MKIQRDKIVVIHRLDAENVDQEDLTKELDSSTGFLISTRITKTCPSVLLMSFDKPTSRTPKLTPAQPTSLLSFSLNKTNLPKIQLPTFGGSYSKNMSFRHQSIASVHYKSQLCYTEIGNYFKFVL